MAEALYKQAQTSGPAGAGDSGPAADGPAGAPGGASGDVIDAEVVDDEKK